MRLSYDCSLFCSSYKAMIKMWPLIGCQMILTDFEQCTITQACALHLVWKDHSRGHACQWYEASTLVAIVCLTKHVSQLDYFVAVLDGCCWCPQPRRRVLQRSCRRQRPQEAEGKACEGEALSWRCWSKPFRQGRHVTRPRIVLNSRRST
jgi:hypothetical protein